MQTAGGGRIQPGASAFAPRRSGGSKDYPRYVDPRDRDILETLTSWHFDGPWDLKGAAGFELLQQALATGRTFWRTLPGAAALEETASLQDVPSLQGATPQQSQALRAGSGAECALRVAGPAERRPAAES